MIAGRRRYIGAGHGGGLYSSACPARCVEPSITMTEKEGILRLQPSGRWAVCRSGRTPVEITSGELFRIEVDGELKITRMEFRRSNSRATTRLTTTGSAMARALQLATMISRRAGSTSAISRHQVQSSAGRPP